MRLNLIILTFNQPPKIPDRPRNLSNPTKSLITTMTRPPATTWEELTTSLSNKSLKTHIWNPKCQTKDFPVVIKSHLRKLPTIANSKTRILPNSRILASSRMPWEKSPASKPLQFLSVEQLVSACT